MSKHYAAFNTKEEFDKWFDKIFEDGRRLGFKDGRVDALSYFVELIATNGDGSFTKDETDSAFRLQHQRSIKRWREQEESRRLLIERTRKEVLESLGKG